MPIVFECPHCHARHRVKQALAGARAKCKCGQRLTVPPGTTANDSSQQKRITVACNACFQEHRVDEALAGKTVKCPCGATFQVPGKTPPLTPLEGLLDELTEADRLNHAGQKAKEEAEQRKLRMRRKDDWEILGRYVNPDE